MAKKPEVIPEESTAELTQRVAATMKARDAPAPVKVKEKLFGRKAAAARSKGEVNPYAEYAPPKFSKHPVARGIDFALDQLSPPEAGEQSAKQLEVGEAWAAAAYWAIGLPPYSPSVQGDGHPYIVAAERTGKWGWFRLKRGGKVDGIMQAMRAKMKRKGAN